MGTRWQIPILALSFAFLSACMHAPAKPESRIDPNANIPSMATFGWQPANSNLVSTDVTERKFDEAVRAAVTTELQHRGYTLVERDPDLLVAYDVSPFEKTSSNPFSVGVGMGSWGGNVGGGVGVGTGGGTSTVQGSRVTVHVVSRKTDQEVYLGTMTGNIAPGSSAADVSGVVSQAMRDFPARRP